MVKVYTIQSCPWCEKVKKYLASRGVNFTAFDIEKDVAARYACIKLTGMDGAVPVVTADDKTYVLDFDKEQIDKLLGI